MTEGETVGWHHRLNGLSLSKLQEIVKDREGKPGMLQFMGSQRVRQDWATEQQQFHSPSWKNCCLVAQSHTTLCDPMNYSPSGSSLHGSLQARKLEWIVMPSSRGSSRPRYWTHISHIAGRFFTAEPPEKPVARLKNLICKIRDIPH